MSCIPFSTVALSVPVALLVALAGFVCPTFRVSDEVGREVDWEKFKVNLESGLDWTGAKGRRPHTTHAFTGSPEPKV